jgi:hypothetical protein
MIYRIDNIEVVDLHEEKNEKELGDYINSSMSTFKEFNFEEKIETIVLFKNRDDFSSYIGNRYGIMDRYSLGGKAIHYPYGHKSIIGVEQVEGHENSLLTHELGHAIEHFKLKNDEVNYSEWNERDGYGIWSEFFCQAHGSFNRKADIEYDDIYLRSFPDVLEDKKVKFNKQNIDRTFLLMIYSMSDLFYYHNHQNSDSINYYLDEFQKMTNSEFIELYKRLFADLNSYLQRNGLFFKIPHDYDFFESLEQYKKDFTDFF